MPYAHVGQSSVFHEKKICVYLHYEASQWLEIYVFWLVEEKTEFDFILGLHGISARKDALRAHLPEKVWYCRLYTQEKFLKSIRTLIRSGISIYCILTAAFRWNFYQNIEVIPVVNHFVIKEFDSSSKYIKTNIS